MAHADKASSTDTHLVGGMILIGAGVLFMLHNLDVIYIGSIFDFWPLLLIWCGYKKLRFPKKADDRKSGMWLLTIGSILLVLNLELFGMGWSNAWPLLMVGAGWVLIWQAFALPIAPNSCQEDGNGY